MATEKIEDKDKEKKAPKTAKTAKTEKTAETAGVKKTAAKPRSESKAPGEAKISDKGAGKAAVEAKPASAKAASKPAAETAAPVTAAKKAESKTPGEAKGGEAKHATKQTPKESPKASKADKGPKHTPRLKQHYDSVVVKALNDLYKYSSPMAIPKVVKVILNIGIGEATSDKTVVDSAVEELTTIAAQKAVKTFAKKSISNFHLREGMPIGARVTLRGTRMYDFMDKFISVALPRVRDFKGLSSSSFDGRGNYTIGLKEQLVFPEINYDTITKIRGMDVTIVTTAANDDEAYQLLKTLGFPFKEK
jgi:large subunit ribosomal protein L5